MTSASYVPSKVLPCLMPGWHFPDGGSWRELTPSEHDTSKPLRQTKKWRSFLKTHVHVHCPPPEDKSHLVFQHCPQGPSIWKWCGDVPQGFFREWCLWRDPKAEGAHWCQGSYDQIGGKWPRAKAVNALLWGSSSGRLPSLHPWWWLWVKGPVDLFTFFKNLPRMASPCLPLGTWVSQPCRGLGCAGGPSSPPHSWPHESTSPVLYLLPLRSRHSSLYWISSQPWLTPWTREIPDKQVRFRAVHLQECSILFRLLFNSPLQGWLLTVTSDQKTVGSMSGPKGQSGGVREWGTQFICSLAFLLQAYLAGWRHPASSQGCLKPNSNF